MINNQLNVINILLDFSLGATKPIPTSSDTNIYCKCSTTKVGSFANKQRNKKYHLLVLNTVTDVLSPRNGAQCLTPLLYQIF